MLIDGFISEIVFREGHLQFHSGHLKLSSTNLDAPLFQE